MKKFINSLLGLVLAILLFASCTSKSVEPAVNTTESLTAALTSGTWFVSSHIQKTEDKTSKYTDYTFTFSADNKVIITAKNGKLSSGTWSYTPAVTYYGSTSKEAISLNMGVDKPLDALTKKWNFISSTTTSFKVDSPELTEDEHLQFSKK
jgi:hypothetical protein